MHFLKMVMSFLFSETKLMHRQFTEMDDSGMLEHLKTNLNENRLLQEWNSSLVLFVKHEDVPVFFALLITCVPFCMKKSRISGETHHFGSRR